MNTGDLIQLYRKKKGLSLMDLATKIGISKQSVYLYERSLRTPSPSNAMKICSVLGIDLDEFQSTLPSFQTLPKPDEIDINPKLAINAQIATYVDTEDRNYILFMCEILESLNYDVTISKNTVIIERLNGNESTIYINLDKFTTIAHTAYFMNNGLIDTLKNESCK